MVQPYDTSSGWGAISWGDAAWGATSTAQVPPNLISAICVGEQTLRLTFASPVFLTNLGDVWDAAQPSHYILATVAGSVDQNGVLARPVAPTGASYPEGVSPQEAGSIVDVTLDRAVSAWPAQYTVTTVGLVGPQGASPVGTLPFFGVSSALPQAQTIPRPIRRDFANPYSGASLAQAGVPNDPAYLGTFAIDGTGDYAIDSGEVDLKKRIYRRFITRPNAFAHLPGYGIGISSYLKKLNQDHVVVSLTNLAEAQIQQEPEVSAVKVVIGAQNNGLCQVMIYIRTKDGQGKKFSAAFTGGL